MTLCQSCELGRHIYCEVDMGEECDCFCHGGAHYPSQIDPDYANEAAREQADLRRKERREG